MIIYNLSFAQCADPVEVVLYQLELTYYEIFIPNDSIAEIETHYVLIHTTPQHITLKISTLKYQI